MNKEWAKQRLNSYLAAIREYEHHLYSDSFNAQVYEKVISLEPAAKAIMKRVNFEYRDYQFVQNAHNLALTLTIQTLALIDEADEIEKNLDPVGPQLPAAELHYWVWEAARSLWETQHYREAVQAAATSINAHLQDLACRRDVSDYKLIAELLSDKNPEPGKPRLRWPGNPSDEAFKSMQTGLRSLGSGIFQCIRNSTTHDLTELTEGEALERLAAMSLLCRWIEQCRLDTVE